MTPDKDLEAVLETDRYIIDGRELGRGCWGRVIRAKDKHDREYALKILDPSELALEQMTHRNLDEVKAMRKEEGELAPCANVVPRRLEFDKKGRPFIAMPVYHSFLSNQLLGDRYLGHGLTLEQVATYLSSLANGIYEMHWKMGRVHGDIKADNLAIDEKGQILLTDLGTSTMASVGKSISPRDNMGYANTRAPECFEEGSHPERKADIWAFGSLAYRLLTGKYILEDELPNAKDPAVLIAQLNEFDKNYKTIGDTIIQTKIKKNVPKEFRKLLLNCLGFRSRLHDGEALKHEVGKTIEELDTWKKFKKRVKEIALAAGLPMIVGGGLIYSGMKHEPKELTMPELKTHDTLIHYKAPNYLPADIERIGMEFDREELDLPAVDQSKKLNSEWNIRMSTENRYVAYLMKTHELSIGTGYPTESQQRIFWNYSYSTEHEMGADRFTLRALARCIEVGLVYSKTPEGKIDLEDVCTIARVGPDKLWEARRAINSFEFKKYVSAKDKDGNFIIPLDEQNLIKTWLAYTKTK